MNQINARALIQKDRCQISYAEHMDRWGGEGGGAGKGVSGLKPWLIKDAEKTSGLSPTSQRYHPGQSDFIYDFIYIPITKKGQRHLWGVKCAKYKMNKPSV